MRSLIIAAILLAGCSGPAAETDHEPIMHDVGPDRVVVMDETISLTGFSVIGNPSHTFPVRNAIPPGTEKIEITINAALLGSHDPPELQYQTAFNDEWRDTEFAFGQPTKIYVYRGHADPPGQAISSWEFRLRYPANTPVINGGLGEGHVEIVAFLGHTENAPANRPMTDRVPILDGEALVAGTRLARDCVGVTGCVPITRATNPIPPEARVVEIHVGHTGIPPELRYHTGAGWEWHEAEALVTGPTSTVFRIDVEEPDSIHAQKSAWEFEINADAPLDPHAGRYVFEGYALL